MSIEKARAIGEAFGRFILNRVEVCDHRINEFIVEADITGEDLMTLVEDFVGSGYALIDETKGIDVGQIQKGIKVEMEHIEKNDPFGTTKALSIAIDHLKENPKYYDYLDKMEKQMGVKKESARREEPIRWVASVKPAAMDELKPDVKPKRFKDIWEENDERYPITAVLIDISRNANDWGITKEELGNIAAQVDGLQIRKDHSSNRIDDVAGVWESGKVVGDTVVGKGWIEERKTAKKIHRRALKDVSMSGVPERAVCSKCGEDTLHGWSCKCDDAYEVVSGMKVREGSIVTDGAYENAKIFPFAAAMQRWASKNVRKLKEGSEMSDVPAKEVVEPVKAAEEPPKEDEKKEEEAKCHGSEDEEKKEEEKKAEVPEDVKEEEDTPADDKKDEVVEKEEEKTEEAQVVAPVAPVAPNPPPAVTPAMAAEEEDIGEVVEAKSVLAELVKVSEIMKALDERMAKLEASMTVKPGEAVVEAAGPVVASVVEEKESVVAAKEVEPSGVEAAKSEEAVQPAVAGAVEPEKKLDYSAMRAEFTGVASTGPAESRGNADPLYGVFMELTRSK